jgi:hypothetical protein
MIILQFKTFEILFVILAPLPWNLPGLSREKGQKIHFNTYM